MNILSRVNNSAIVRGLREIKVNCFGSDDVRTANQINPFGEDSNPIAGMKAVYMDTSNNSEPVIIGYVNDKLEANKGEKRIYSLDSEGNVSYFVWLKNDGTCLLNGDVDNAVRFLPVAIGLSDMTDLINIELGKIKLGIVAAGGTYEPDDITIDIDDAKIEELKTN